jgi:hypothetical protein
VIIQSFPAGVIWFLGWRNSGLATAADSVKAGNGISPEGGSVGAFEMLAGRDDGCAITGSHERPMY